MTRRYYPESDGGDTFVGTHWSRQPKTFYVFDSHTGERVAECKTWAETKQEAEARNNRVYITDYDPETE